jgi:2,4-dienoyl-CoA reductase-like NADH-dependent reductase (Old Yellow Enzyme family)
VEIENRVAMTPMGVNLAAAGVNEDIITFYETRAGGGIGLIISAIGQVTDGAGASEPCQFAAPGSENPQGLEQFVDAVHQYGTRMFMQLHHPRQLEDHRVHRAWHVRAALEEVHGRRGGWHA